MPCWQLRTSGIRTWWITVSKTLVMISVLLLADSDHCHAQRLSYRPESGQAYEYGVEFRIQSKDRLQSEFRRRNRIRFEILQSDSGSWTAKYLSHPVGAPSTRPVIRNTRNPFQPRTGSPPIPSIPGQPAIIRQQMARAEQAREQAWERMQESRKREQERFDLYPGLYQRCEGTVRVGSDGEVLEDSSNTDLPMLAGSLMNAPLVRLPQDGNVVGTASYRDVLNVSGQASDTGREVQTKYSLLVTHRPHREQTSWSGDSDLIRFQRDMELAGGVHSEFEFRMSGSGEFAFSLSDGMPDSGTLLIDSSGLSWNGNGNQFVLRISFRRLNEWTGPLFDAQMLPNAEALSRQAMPRLSPAEQSQIRKLVTGKEESRGSARNLAARRAPLPLDSRLELELQKLAATLSSTDATSSGGTSRGSSRQRDRAEDAKEAKRILDRWKEIREAAAGVQREWSDASGTFRIQAALLGRTETEAILMRVEDRKRIRVPFEKLSEEDREIAMTFGRTAQSIR